MCVLLTSVANDQISKLREILQARKAVVQALKDQSPKEKNQNTVVSQAITSRISATQEDNIDKLALQKCCLLTSLFLIRRRKARRGSSRKEPSSKSSRPVSPQVFETSIAFMVLPDLTVLPRYTHSIINYSIERLAYFCFYIADYLQLTLPYTILPPQKMAPFVRVYDNLKHSKRALVLRQSVKSVVQSSPKDFDVYAGGLAMLALDLSYISSMLSSAEAGPIDVEAVVQVDKTLLALQETLTLTPNLHQILAQSPRWQYQRQQLRQQDQVLEVPAFPDLDDVIDYIITRNFVEINGGSAEWNLVDKDDDELN